MHEGAFNKANNTNVQSMYGAIKNHGRAVTVKV